MLEGALYKYSILIKKEKIMEIVLAAFIAEDADEIEWWNEE